MDRDYKVDFQAMRQRHASETCSYSKIPPTLESLCSKLNSLCHLRGPPISQFACFRHSSTTRVFSVNAGVLRFSFINDEMPLNETINGESLYYI